MLNKNKNDPLINGKKSKLSQRDEQIKARRKKLWGRQKKATKKFEEKNVGLKSTDKSSVYKREE